MAHLPDTVVIGLLKDEAFAPGPRPFYFSGVVAQSPSGRGGGWVFKETGEERGQRRPKLADHWRNTGGIKGARNLPATGGPPQLRRRYGKLTPDASNLPLVEWTRGTVRGTLKPRKPTLSFHEYTLLSEGAGGEIEENKGVYLFHVVPLSELGVLVPRLGLPHAITMTADETAEMAAIMRVEGFEHSDGPLPEVTVQQAVGEGPARPDVQAPDHWDLPAAELVRMLCDDSFQPGRRPGLLLDPSRTGWVYKEPSKSQPRRGKNMDR
jgi:hypothetical protein